MKTLKYILGVFFIIGSLGNLVNGSVLSSVFTLALGVSLLPPISDQFKEKFKLWQSKGIRYVTYIMLLIISSITSVGMKDFEHKKQEKSITPTKENKKETVNKTKDEFNFKTCNYAGGEFYIIPDLKAADVYINFVEKGFNINKNIKTEGTDIHCSLSKSNVQFDVIITGCTPNKIISVEAMTIDYSGNNSQEVKAFLGYVATTQYKNSNPELARKWVEDNINIDGAKTTIEGVTFSINFKSKHSKSFSMKIEEPTESPKEQDIHKGVIKVDGNGKRINQ